MNKIAKTPPITSKTKILCFDLETNGLHGQAFAVGALIIDASGKVHDQFVARTKIKGKLDDWVAQNVMPSITDVSVTYPTYKALREAFWQWFVAAQKTSDYVVVSNGYPVEYRFLLQCQQDNLDERYWQHPFPFIDLSSLFLLLGGQTTKKQLQQDVVEQYGPFKPHHPFDDAKVSALTTFAALRKAGTLKSGR